MTIRQRHALRGAAWSSIATLAAATSHTVAGGPAPAMLLVVAMAVLLTPVTAALAGARTGLGRLAGAVGLGQVAFHAVFQLLGAPTGQGPSIGGRHAHHGAALLLRSAAADAGARTEDAGMYLAHAVAAALTVALLWRGEQAIRAIAHATVSVLRRVRARRLPVSARPPRAVAAPPLPAATSGLLSAASRRGPPVPLGA
jgi:hypothetical protein